MLVQFKACLVHSPVLILERCRHLVIVTNTRNCTGTGRLLLRKLLDHVLDGGLELGRARRADVLVGVAVLDEQEGGDGGDSVAGRDVGHGVNVHLGEGNASRGGVLSRMLLEQGRHGLARAAPRRVEVDDSVRVGAEEGVELGGAVDGRDLIVVRHLDIHNNTHGIPVRGFSMCVLDNLRHVIKE